MKDRNICVLKRIEIEVISNGLNIQIHSNIVIWRFYNPFGP